jgi:hypothetical protein
LAVVTATMFVQATFARAQSDSPYGRNLVVNGGAGSQRWRAQQLEDRKAFGLNNDRRIHRRPVWSVGRLPRQNVAGTNRSGQNLFEGGNVTSSTATQTISLAEVAADIAKGNVKYEFTAWEGGYSSQDDNAKATLAFYDRRRQDDQSNAARSGACCGPQGSDRASLTPER